MNITDIIGRFLCSIGIHKINEDEWLDSYDFGEEYIGELNWCDRCGKMIKRDE